MPNVVICINQQTTKWSPSQFLGIMLGLFKSKLHL